MLPKIAIHGLQMVSPPGGCAVAEIDAVPGIDAVAGIDDPGPGVTLGVVMIGNGGGPAAGTGVGTATGAVGSGGGFADEEEGEDSAVGGEADFSTGSGAGFSVKAAAEDSDLVFGRDSRNSGIGCHADFDSLQARSAAVKLPSAIFSRMADSEKRPASCPFL
jgi:hypothetical protein